MRWPGLVPWVVAGVAACASGGGRAPVASVVPLSDSITVPEVALRLPQAIGEFRFVGRQDFDDPSQGAMFRFRHADSLQADVFLYPGPDLDTNCALACARTALKGELDGFRTALEDVQARGQLERFRILSGADIPRPADAPWAIGHRLHLQVRVAGVEEHSEYWLVYLRGVRMKVRSTYVETAARTAALERFLGDVADAFAVPTVPEPVRNERPLPAATDAETIFRMLEGQWSWEGGEDECKASMHTLSLSDDRRWLELRYVGRTDSTDSTGAPVVVRYRVVEAGPQVLPWAPHTIRLEMEGEDRRTDAGALVVWDLVFQSPDRYHWHRTDWDAGGLTKAIIRCDAPARRP
jgi:hypothetical protein